MLAGASPEGGSLRDAFAAGANDFVHATASPEERRVRVGAVVRLGALLQRARDTEQQLAAELVDTGSEFAEIIAALGAHPMVVAPMSARERVIGLVVVGIVSHELRTPLNAMLGWVHLLRSGMLTDEKRERALATAERNALAQAQLVEDLLDVSRIVSGKLALDVKTVDPADAIEAALDVVRPAADAKGVRLAAVLDRGTGTIAGDPRRLPQVAWNLLSNAVKFTPRGGTVTARLVPRGDGVAIRVEDTGQGIDGAFLPHVFERFRQADGSSTRAQGGLGLGLSIVKTIVEHHHGTVAARSAGPGTGSTFTVYLPRAFAEPPGSAVATAPREAPPSLRGLRVLVVDDEPDARELVAALLDGCGAAVTLASSAADALVAFEIAPPDLPVSDIGMPEADGYSLVRRVRACAPDRGGHVPAISLTAYARDEDRAAAARAGFTAHVAEPVDPDRLLALVATLSRQQR